MISIHRFLKDRNGFTLIELMIVIVVIGILASIAVPKISDVREKANIAVIKSELHNIQTAMEMFYVDHNQYPEDATLTGDATGDIGETSYDLAVNLDYSYTYETTSEGYLVYIQYPASDGQYFYVEDGQGVESSPTNPSE
ncbi:MAG: prepilin-type N-terminal cleavage/methylation domain-containing protein [Halanaerobium sp.]|nr:prepilin-type N-terminal cleavage/methylation domain-containing protein [Halanaerobium sp.]